MTNSLAFNTSFIQAVQKHKCLYNHRDPEYSDRDAQDSAWYSVASEMKGTVDECKAKWKNLRGGLTRYLKLKSQAGTSSKTVKKYYLLDAMKFLIPFTKSKDPNSDLKSSFNLDEFENEENQIKSKSYLSEDDHTTEMQDALLTDSGEDTYILDSDSSHARDTAPSRKRKLSPTDPLENTIETFSSSTSTNPDMDFFKSIVPDLAEFNPSQKRRFKQRVLQIIEEIATENTSRPAYPPNTYSFDAVHYTASSPSTSIVDVKHFNDDSN